jgi:hypothetical protein
MENILNYKVAFWRGVLVGPLAVFPATLAWAVAGAFLQFSFVALIDAVGASIFISIWGVCIAYVAIASYGSLTWAVLLKANHLSLGPLLVCSVVPAVAIGIYNKDVVLTALIGYYSIAVCLASWYVGLRHVQRA